MLDGPHRTMIANSDSWLLGIDIMERNNQCILRHKVLLAKLIRLSDVALLGKQINANPSPFFLLTSILDSSISPFQFRFCKGRIKFEKYLGVFR
jgi:hypothetical protein